MEEKNNETLLFADGVLKAPCTLAKTLLSSGEHNALQSV
jgi:hypothetical protein